MPNQSERQRNELHKTIWSIAAGLPAEIEARLKRYAYYHGKPLSFKEKAA